MFTDGQTDRQTDRHMSTAIARSNRVRCALKMAELNVITKSSVIAKLRMLIYS